MKFKRWSDLRKCKDFNKKLSQYEWGPVGKNLESLDDDDFDNYRTLSPTDFDKVKKGTCWDYVEFQRDWYEDQGISHNVYYLEADNKEKASHTILIAKVGDQFIWDESSWKAHKGLHPSKSKVSLLRTICEKHSKADKDKINQIVVYEYPRPKKFGMTAQAFMSWVKNNGKHIFTWNVHP